MFLPPGFYLAANGLVYSGDGRGPYPFSELGFFLGRRFTAFREFDQIQATQIPAGQRVLLRFTVGVDSLLTLLGFELDNGQIRVTAYRGGVPVGTFSQPVPQLATNTTEEVPSYTSLNSWAATIPGVPAAVGISGGVQLDVLRLKVANQANSSQSASIQQDSERGLGVGVYYLLVENIGAGVAEGVFKARWEELPNS